MSAAGELVCADPAGQVLGRLEEQGCPPESVPGAVDCLWRAACPACCSTWANGAEKPLSVRELGVGGDVGLRCRNGCAEGAIRAELRLPRLSLVSADAGETRERSPDPPPRPAAAKLRRLDVARMLTTEPAPVDWLVEGVAARGALTLLAGREKEGKSMVALAVGACVLSGGGSVAGLTCRPGRVLIVDAENGESEAHRRVRALGLDARHVENIEYVEPRGFDLRGDLRELGRLLERSPPGPVHPRQLPHPVGRRGEQLRRGSERPRPAARTSPGSQRGGRAHPPPGPSRRRVPRFLGDRRERREPPRARAGRGRPRPPATPPA